MTAETSCTQASVRTTAVRIQTATYMLIDIPQSSVHVSFGNAPGEQNIQLSYKPNRWTFSNTNFMSVPI